MTAFERIEWRPDRMLLGDVVFRLQGRANDDWELGEECLVFYKGRRLVDQYADFFSRHPDLCTDNLLELGIFGGGSMAFWLECLRPRKHVGVDIKNQSDTAYFRRFVAERAAGGRIKTYWGTSQDDVPALLRIVRQEFEGPLDLVIDDASHFYEPTLASFEALFPLVRPGGLYIIEDWAWAHWREVDLTSARFLDRAAQLTTLVAELVAATGTDRGLITRVEVRHGFTVVERGPGRLASGTFRLADHIYWRPGQARRDLLRRLRRAGREMFGRRARR